MLVNNLELTFQKTEDDKIFFQTITGEEVVLNKNLLNNSERLSKVFLSLDTQALDDKKEILNELLKQD